MKSSITPKLKFLLSIGLLLTTIAAQADVQADSKESELIPSVEASADLSLRLNLLADECATSDILQMIDLKEGAPHHSANQNNASSIAKASLHADLSDKLILTRSQDLIRKNFYKTSSVKDFNICRKAAVISAKQLCESTLPFEEEAYQKTLEKYKKVKGAKKVAEAKSLKVAARSKWKRHQNLCEQFNRQFDSTEETLTALKDDSKILVFSPTHKHKLMKSVAAMTTEATE